MRSCRFSVPFFHLFVRLSLPLVRFSLPLGHFLRVFLQKKESKSFRISHHKIIPAHLEQSGKLENFRKDSELLETIELSEVWDFPED